jgi:WD40 repeat protein
MSRDDRDELPLLDLPSTYSHADELPSVGSVGPAITHAPNSPTTDHTRYAPGPEIGRGGMGRVRLVEDIRLHRDLAWKEGNATVLREAWVTAQLEHPGILPVHDIGKTDDGQSFFAMRIIRGETLAKVLATHGHPDPAKRRELLRMLLQAAQAVAWAHHRGVVHRDLKPSNILVGPFGEVQVIDWGLAKIQSYAELPLPLPVREAIARHDLREDGNPIGTPGYMAPEQAQGASVDARADVFSLGIILRKVAGPRPSPELRSILAHCLAPAPADRYPDAQHLAADIGAYLDGRRVTAHRYRPVDHLVRFASTFRLPLLIAVLAAFVLLAAVLIANRRVATERDHALTAQRDAEAALRSADTALADALSGHAQAAYLRGLRYDAEVLATRALSHAEHPQARGIVAAFAHSSGVTAHAFAPDARLAECVELQVVKPASSPSILSCTRPDGVHVFDATTFAPKNHIAHLTTTAALDDSGTRLALTHVCDPRVYDRATGVELSAFAEICASYLIALARGDHFLFIGRHHIGPIHRHTLDYRLPELCEIYFGVDLATDGRLAALCGDGTLHLAHLASTAPYETLPTEFTRHGIEATAIAFLDDTTLIVADTAGRVRHLPLDDRPRNEPVQVVRGLIRTLSVSPDRRWLAVAGDAGGVVILDAKTLGFVTSLPPALGHRALWLPDSSIVPYAVESSASARVRFVLAAPPTQLSFGKGVTSLALSPDASHLLVGHMDFASLVDLVHRRPTRRFSAGTDIVKGVSFDSHGHGYFGTSSNFLGRIDLGDDGATTATRLDMPRSGVRRHITAADWLVLAPPRGLIHVARAASTTSDWHHLSVTTDEVDGASTTHATWLDLAPRPGRSGRPGRPEGALLLGSKYAFPLALSDTVPPLLHPAHPLPHSGATAIAVFPDHDRIATTTGDTVWLWDLTSGAIEGILHTGPGAAPDAVDLIEVAVHPDGTWVAAGARDGRLFIWRTDRPDPIAAFAAHTERLVALAFTPDTLITGSWDGAVRFIALAPLSTPRTTLVHDLELRWPDLNTLR